uniref:Uncharacterized protein n=1 Tax=Anguilla anguilla TaxID=7936 RepID=A0A0E9VFQ4_ANGAN
MLRLKKNSILKAVYSDMCSDNTFNRS